MDVSRCAPERLRDARSLAQLFEALVVRLELKVVGVAQWHTFPEPGGVTGLALLSESHLAIHTFPEHRFAALNVYSCIARPPPDFAGLARAHLGEESRVQVRVVERGP